MTDDPASLTTMHVRRAIGGDTTSLEWLVARLSPLLRAQATARLGLRLRTLYEPDDLVNDAWLITLPRLGEFPARDGRYTPVLLGFLSTTLRNRIVGLARRHIRRGRKETVDGARPAGLEDIPAEVSGAVTRAVRHELHDRVTEALGRLEATDREVIVLRGVEQLEYTAAGTILGITPDAVRMRYRRALERLRASLPGSIFDELAED